MKFHQQPITFVSHVQLIVEKLERSLSLRDTFAGQERVRKSHSALH